MSNLEYILIIKAIVPGMSRNRSFQLSSCPQCSHISLAVDTGWTVRVNDLYAVITACLSVSEIR